MARSNWIKACAVGTVLVLGACTKSTPTTGTSPQPAPAKPVAATYTAHEFNFTGPSTLPAGTGDITLKNDGAQQHQLIIVRLDKNQDWTAEDAVNYIKANPNSQPKWAVIVGGVGQPIKPGTSAPAYFGDISKQNAKVSPNGSLDPGSYLMMCFVTDPATKKPHAFLGMVYKVTVA